MKNKKDTIKVNGEWKYVGDYIKFADNEPPYLFWYVPNPLYIKNLMYIKNLFLRKYKITAIGHNGCAQIVRGKKIRGITGNVEVFR